MNPVKPTVETSLLIFLLLLTAAVYVFLAGHLNSNYHPVWSDEFLYFLNAKSSWLNGTLRAAFTCTGYGGKWFGSDTHGFAYPLLHTIVAKIAGWHNLNLIVVNLFFITMSVVISWLLKAFSLTEKLWISLFILLYPVTYIYSFTFMQECMHAFFGLAAGMLLLKIDASKQKKYIILFIVLMLFAGLFRALWPVWLCALIPLAANKKERIIYSCIFLAGLLVTFIFSQFITEQIPNILNNSLASMKSGAVTNGLHTITIHLIQNIMLFFFSSGGSVAYALIKLILVSSWIYFLVMAIQTKSKLHGAIVIPGLANFAMILLFNDVSGWREIRSLSPYYFFLIPFLVKGTGPVFRYMQLTVLAAIFMLTIPVTGFMVSTRDDLMEVNPEKMIAYKLISNTIENEKAILIKHPPPDYSADLLFLPLQNKNGKQIRYVLPWYKVTNMKYDYVFDKNTLTRN